MEEFCEYKKIYSLEQEQLISQEFQRLKGHHYLEHAGATLYSEKQLENVFSKLSENLYANPHARNLSSKLTEDAVDVVRFQILQHFNANSEEYSVIFTSGATASLKLIAECFSYKNQTDENNSEYGTFAYLDDNHTSALSIREHAKNNKIIKYEEAFDVLSKNVEFKQGQINNNSLFAYPAQSNFSGTKYPLQWISKVKKGALNDLTGASSKNWFTVLDAASFVSTNKLDLTVYKPDFVTISFYKIFGYPTGLGALLVKNSSAYVLEKKYFGGGTVLMILSSENVVIPRNVIHEKFEDGSIAFLSILAIREGFETINRFQLDFETISKHVFALAQYVYRNLLIAHHSNGNPAMILYHDTNFQTCDTQGGIINFNLIRQNGEYIGYAEVLHFANLYGIHVRSGCFCNPGACQRFLKLKSSDVIKHFKAGHVCGDQNDLVDGYPTGSVRISFGYMSSKADADKFLEMIRTCFISKPIVTKFPTNLNLNNAPIDDFYIEHKMDLNSISDEVEQENNKLHTRGDSISTGTLREIFLYPVKSCGIFRVLNKWPITATGLKYDRQWMIINSSGVCVTQKQNRKLCLIKPIIDLQNQILKLSFQGHKDIDIPLNFSSSYNLPFPSQSKVCGDKIQGWDCGNEVAEWLNEVLDCRGLHLLKQCGDLEEMCGRTSKKKGNLQLSLANEAQYLLVNLSSVGWLKDKIPEDILNEDLISTVQRFRPNFVVEFEKPFIENCFDELILNDVRFKNAGKCNRCQMICIDQANGETTKEPLQTLSREFKGKISFGIYLNNVVGPTENYLFLESEVTGHTLQPL